MAGAAMSFCSLRERMGYAWARRIRAARERTVTLDIPPTIRVDTEKVTVADTAKVDLDPASNAGALVFRGRARLCLEGRPRLQVEAAEWRELAHRAAGQV